MFRLLLWGFTLLYLSAGAQSGGMTSKTKIYLIRHAEKGTGTDPALTVAGKARAGELVRILRKQQLVHIYVTEFQRTQQTSDSLRLQLGIDTIHYFADTSLIGGLIAKIRANKDTGRTILIIGHSNTVPLIIRRLGVKKYPLADIPDNQFDNLFIITYPKGIAQVKKRKYGAATPAH